MEIRGSGRRQRKQRSRGGRGGGGGVEGGGGAHGDVGKGGGGETLKSELYYSKIKMLGSCFTITWFLQLSPATSNFMLYSSSTFFFLSLFLYVHGELGGCFTITEFLELSPPVLNFMLYSS